MLTRILEFNTRTGDKVLYRSGNDHLTRCCRIHDACGEVNSNPEHVCFASLYFARVQPGADLNAKGGHRLRNRPCTLNSPSRAVEKGKKPIPKRLHLTASKSDDFPAYSRVMCLQQLPPHLVPQFLGSFGRADDVGKQDSRQHAP